MAKTDRGYGPLDNHMYMYDLGWLVKTILSFREELDTAIDLKTIHYADPIQWDITTQYSPNTVVVDPKTGTAYMSKVPVPAGIQLDNTDYWVVIFNYQRIYDKIMSGVAFNDKENLTASKDISKYDFVWFGGDLYQAQRDIPQGSKYVPGVNIVATTIANALATYYGRDRVAQVINDTLTASETQTIGAKNRVINVTGDQTVTAGDIAETSANRTIKATADYHIDVDGDLSDHVDGVTTVNRGGAVTEAYGSSLDVGVTGTYTAEYSGAVTETYNGKHMINGKDTIINTSEPVTYQTPKSLTAQDWYRTITLKTPDTNTPYNVLVQNPKKDGTKNTSAVNIKALTDNEDITAALKEALAVSDRVYIPEGEYIISDIITLNEKLIFGDGPGQTLLKMKNNSYFNCPDSTYNRYCQISDLAMLAQDESPYAIYVSESALESGWGSCIHINNVRLENFKKYNLYLINGNQCEINNLVFYSGTCYIGASGGKKSRIVSNNNLFERCWFANPNGYLFELANAQNNTFESCVFAESSCYFSAYQLGLDNINNCISHSWFEPATLFLEDTSAQHDGNALALPLAVLTLRDNFYTYPPTYKFFKDICMLGGHRQIVATGGGFTYDQFYAANSKEWFYNYYIEVDKMYIPYFYSTALDAYTKLGINSNESKASNATSIRIPLAAVLDGIAEAPIKSSSFICDVSVITPANKMYSLKVAYVKDINRYIVENNSSTLKTSISGNWITVSSTDETSPGVWYGYSKLNNFHPKIK